MSQPRLLAIGTRASALAMAQATILHDALAAIGVAARIVPISTDGDVRAADTAWGEGAFVTAIEAALLDGRIDIAIHSAKDVPSEEDTRLAIAAYLPRADPRDALVIGSGLGLEDAPRTLGSLPAGARVGTDSPRRTAFLRAVRPDLTVHSLHGNVDTRLRRLDAGETDALVLAAAGLDRMGLAQRIACRFEAHVIPPAPGQGALAIQTRTGDAPTRALVGRLDDQATRRTVELERAILARSGGGCRAPLGVLAIGDAEGITVSAGYARLAGDLAVHSTRRSVAASDDGLAAAVLADLVDRAIDAAMAGDAPRVIVTRETERAAATALALVDRGLAPIVVPCIAVTLETNQDLDTALGGLADRLTADWIVLTSVNAVRAVRSAADRLGLDLSIVPGPRWAAIGQATAAAMREAGIRVDEQPPRADGRSLAASLSIVPGSRVLLPRGDLADEVLPLALAARGSVVTSIVVYRTVEAPDGSAALLGAALDERPLAVVATSGSTVRGLLALGRAIGVEDRIRMIPLVAIGPGTAAEAVRLGFDVAGHAAMQGPGGIADAVAAAVA